VAAIVERLDGDRSDRVDVVLEPRLVVRHTTSDGENLSQSDAP
jgi:hypothetical protein